MLEVRSTKSLEEPALKPYLTLRRPEEHQSQRLLVAEGQKTVRRLLASHFEVVSLLITEEWLERLRPILEQRPERIQVFVADKPLIERMTGYWYYQGLLAVGRIPPSPPLDALLASRPRPYLFVATDRLCNAENIGSLVRNCAAFGVTALLDGESSSSPYLRRSVRGSMGAIFRLPVIETASLAETLRELRRLGVKNVAAHPHAEGTTLARADLAGDCCVVLGSEGEGISPEILAMCDEAVAIPMSEGVDSLNVGVASAVFLYEANRQRGRM